MTPRSLFLANSMRQWLIAAAVLVAALATPAVVVAQATISSTTQRPFVIATIPVIGRNGAVGGVSIDAHGVLSRASSEEADQLARQRRSALAPLAGDISQSSELRKISLRGLEAVIAEHRARGAELSDEVLHLAGLQRVTHLFVDAERGDIVLAGPAEGWTIDQAGDAVGVNSGLPVVELVDLVAALRTAEAASRHVISCSIDPTDEGLQRLAQLMDAPGLQMSAATVASMEKAVGPQQVTVVGAAPDSHFARVMVAADFLMKRLAMGFEPSSVEGLSSFMELVKNASSRPPRSMMPRWWLAASYEAVLRDADGLAWRLRGTGVRTMTEDALAEETGQSGASRSGRMAQKWADDFTEHYEAVAKRMPVFGKLRNCIDLSVIAALIVREDLPNYTRLHMPLLMDERQLQFSGFHAPKTVDSKATFFRKGRNWVISVSGGVDIDSWGVLEREEIDQQLAAQRSTALARPVDRWWWD